MARMLICLLLALAPGCVTVGGSVKSSPARERPDWEVRVEIKMPQGQR